MNWNAPTRISAVGAMGLALSVTMVCGAVLAQGAVTLKGLALDTADNNRFFTRLAAPMDGSLLSMSGGLLFLGLLTLYSASSDSSARVSITPVESAGLSTRPSASGTARSI